MKGFVQRNRAGISLLEVMVSTALIVAVFNVGASIFVLSGRITAVSTIALDRLDGVQEAQTVFTETVRGASAVVDTAGGFSTGADRVVLQTMNGVTVFGRLGESDQLGVVRLVERDGTWESDYVRPLRQRFSEIEFRVGEHGVVEMDLMVWRDPDERPGNPARYRARAVCRGITIEGHTS